MLLLETKRLIVKLTGLENLKNIHALYSDPEVMLYVGRGVKTLEESCEAVKAIIHHQEKHGCSSGDVYEKETDLYIGRSGLIYLEMKDDQPDIEVGCILHKQFWKKGYGMELVQAFIEWGFKNLPVSKIVATLSSENAGSRRIVEKMGMTYVGNIPYHSRVHSFDKEAAKYEILRSTFSKNESV